MIEAVPVIKVIVVDNSPIIAQRLEFLLTDIAHITLSGIAGNIPQAINLIIDQKPDVVILDIHLQDILPEANGMNLLVTLKKNYPKMKVIMLTNLSEQQYRNACLAAGADYFLDKSNDFDKIADTLKEIQLLW